MATLRRPLLIKEAQKTLIFNDKERTLTRLNIAAFIIHAISFVGALVMSIVFSSQSVQGEVTTDFTKSGGTVTLESLGTYPLIWVDLPFPAITALFHALIAWAPMVKRAYSRWVFTEDRNPLRWLEYSITASLMTWVICQLSGMTNVFLLLMVAVVGNVALQIQGYLMEVLNIRVRRVNWIPMLIGWLIFAAQWAFILSYFIVAVQSSVTPVPWFVYVIVIGLLLQFSLFGLILVFHYLGWLSNYGTEIAYIVLSFTSKLFLTWNLLIGIAT